MKLYTPIAVPLLALALAAVPAHSQQYGPQGPPPPPQGYGQGGYGQGQYGGGGQWDAPPSEFSEFSRRGFHDGLEAARGDWEARRPMEATRNPMFRRPPVPRRFRDDYRNGFTRGYDAAMRHHGGGPRPGDRYPR